MKLLVIMTAGLIGALGCVVPIAIAGEDDINLSLRGCQAYARWSGNLVWASDLDAQEERARNELIELDRKRPSSIYALMLKNLDALWTTQASWEQVTLLVLHDCVARQGRYHLAGEREQEP